MTQQFHVVANTIELAEGEQMYVQLDEAEILLCRHQDEFFAIAYLCSHAEFTLEGGTMENGCITCPYHGAEFCLKDGAVTAPPAWERIKVYPLKVEEGNISICSTPKEV